MLKKIFIKIKKNIFLNKLVIKNFFYFLFFIYIINYNYFNIFYNKYIS